MVLFNAGGDADYSGDECYRDNYGGGGGWFDCIVDDDKGYDDEKGVLVIHVIFLLIRMFW